VTLKHFYVLTFGFRQAYHTELQFHVIANVSKL